MAHFSTRCGEMAEKPFPITVSADMDRTQFRWRQSMVRHIGKTFMVISLCISLCSSVLAAEISKLAPDTRLQKASMVRVSNKVDLISKMSPDKEAIAQTGKQLALELRKASDLTKKYQRANSRYGTLEEKQNLSTILIQALSARNKWGSMAGLSKFDLYHEQKAQARSELETELRRYIGNRLEEKLEVEGISDILVAKGVREIRQAAERTIQTRVRNKIEAQLANATGFQISMDAPLRQQVRNAARNAARSEIKKLLFKVTSSSLIVSLASSEILKWLGPKLKELVRHKGHLASRVERTLKGFEKRRLALHSLKPNAKLTAVTDALENAEGAMSATDYLKGDLKRRNQTALLNKLEKGESNIRTTMKFTKNRFLMNSDLYQGDFSELTAMLAKMTAEVETAIAKLSQHTPDLDCSKILGSWKWPKGSVSFTGDSQSGSANATSNPNISSGVWRCTDQEIAEVTWDGGKYVDTVKMSGATLSVTNQNGYRFKATGLSPENESSTGETCEWRPGGTIFPSACVCTNASGATYTAPHATCGH